MRKIYGYVRVSTREQCFDRQLTALKEKGVQGQNIYMDKISGTDAEGGEHFPGWSLDALKYIYETRNAAANGHETLDTDASKEAAAAGDLACERYVLAQGKLQVEVLRNLDQVAEAGAVVIVAYPRIEGANGMPARVFAITE